MTLGGREWTQPKVLGACDAVLLIETKRSWIEGYVILMMCFGEGC